MAATAQYRKVFETLRDEILRGVYASARQFPSSVVLAQRFGVTRFTVRSAMDELRRQGLVVCQRGIGTFVTRKATARKIAFFNPGGTPSEFYHEVMSETNRLARASGYAFTFCDVPGTSDVTAYLRKVRELAAELIRSPVDGVIYKPVEYALDGGETNRALLADFARTGIPVVLLDTDVALPPDGGAYDLVAIDNMTAGATLARHLRQQGARNIHFLMERDWQPNVQERLRGVIGELLVSGGVWAKDHVLLACPRDAAAVRSHLRRRPDAFVCYNDESAAVLTKTLEALGRCVPDDILVAGFDDVNVARLATPSLTTMRQPCADLAAAAFNRLLARIARPTLRPQRILFTASLVVRASTQRTENPVAVRKTRKSAK